MINDLNYYKYFFNQKELGNSMLKLILTNYNKNLVVLHLENCGVLKNKEIIKS